MSLARCYRVIFSKNCLNRPIATSGGCASRKIDICSIPKNDPVSPKTSTRNGWYLFAHPLFLDQYQSLIAEVQDLREKYPNSYKDKPQTKRLAAITQLIYAKIPKDPALPEYQQGNTLGPDYRHWRRAKFFQQYRLFFRYHFESKMIVYSWVNDENTKRAYHSKTDAYLVFRKMLQKGNPPDNWQALLDEAKRMQNSGVK